jgi:hypothetical protein
MIYVYSAASPRQSGFGGDLALEMSTGLGTPVIHADPLLSPERKSARWGDWKERGSRDRKDSRGHTQPGTPGTPPMTSIPLPGSGESRRISVTDSDALLPPALDLGMVREMFGCLDAQVPFPRLHHPLDAFTFNFATCPCCCNE